MGTKRWAGKSKTWLSIRDNGQQVEYRGHGEEGNGELVFHGYRVSVADDEKVLEIDSGDGCMTMYNVKILCI